MKITRTIDGASSLVGSRPPNRLDSWPELYTTWHFECYRRFVNDPVALDIVDQAGRVLWAILESAAEGRQAEIPPLETSTDESGPVDPDF